MFRAPHIISGWEWFPVIDWRGKPTFHKHLKRSLSSEIGMWEGLCVFCLKFNGPRYAMTSNTEEAEVEQFYEHLQDLLELTPKKMSFSLQGTKMQK